MSDMKDRGSTPCLSLKLLFSSEQEVCGIYGVGVQSVDTIKNTKSEGSLLEHF